MWGEPTVLVRTAWNSAVIMFNFSLAAKTPWRMRNSGHQNVIEAGRELGGSSKTVPRIIHCRRRRVHHLDCLAEAWQRDIIVATKEANARLRISLFIVRPSCLESKHLDINRALSIPFSISARFFLATSTL